MNWKCIVRITFCIILLLEPALGVFGAKRTLHIYNWWSYIDDQTIREFESKYNVKVVLDIFRTNEELIEKLLSGGNAIYDLVFPTDRNVKTLKELGLLSKLNKELIPNIAQLRRDLPNSIYDSLSEYSVPYQWGTVAVVYNKEKFDIKEGGLNFLFDPPEFLKGRIAINGNLRETIAIALTYHGYDINTCDKIELSAAKETLLKIKPFIKVESDIVPALVKGDIWLALSWQGEGIFAQRFNPSIDFYIPNEQPVVFCDVMVIPNKAPNKVLAHQFINYVSSVKVNARISNYTAYNTPNIYSVQYITNESQKKLHGKLLGGSLKDTKYIKDVSCINEYNKLWRNFSDR